jgi:hypothetical protein
MKSYDECIGYETSPPSEIIDLLHIQVTITEELMSLDDSLLDEHELAMAA